MFSFSEFLNNKLILNNNFYSKNLLCKFSRSKSSNKKDNNNFCVHAINTREMTTHMNFVVSICNGIVCKFNTIISVLFLKNQIYLKRNLRSEAFSSLN